MIWVIALVLVLLVGGIAVVAAGEGETLAPTEDDSPHRQVPDDRTVTAEDLRSVRFGTVAFGGYRPDEVDALVDRLARELEER